MLSFIQYEYMEVWCNVQVFKIGAICYSLEGVLMLGQLVLMLELDERQCGSNPLNLGYCFVYGPRVPLAFF